MVNKKLLLCFLIIAAPILSFAQAAPLWDDIDSAILRREELTSTYDRLKIIGQNSRQQGDYVSYSRALFDRMLIRDLRSEDSAYFQNSAFIDTLLLSKATPSSLKALLHLIQAHRLSAFQYRKLRFNRFKYETPNLAFNYAAWRSSQMDSAIQQHFELAKDLASFVQDSSSEPLLWLSANPLAFLFKPTFCDIVVADQIAYTRKQSRLNVADGKLAAEMMLLSTDAFIKKLDSLSLEPGTSKTLCLYSQWIENSKSHPSAYYYIEALVRQYLAPYWSRAAYESYLLSQSKSPWQEVKAYSIYQLCLLWNRGAMDREAELNSPDFEWYSEHNSSSGLPNIQPAKALDLYSQNEAIFYQFGYLKTILDKMRTDILKRNLTWKMEKHAPSGSPLLVRLTYKNIDHLYYRVVQLSQDDVLSHQEKDILSFLNTRPLVRADSVTLPLPADHGTHHSFLKVDPLPTGRYCLLLSDTSESTSQVKGWVDFSITNLAIAPTDGRIYVLDRTTGYPVTGANVDATSVLKHRGQRAELIHANFTTGGMGYAAFNGSKKYHLMVTHGCDTLVCDTDEMSDEASSQTIDKDETLSDFYESNARLNIFTDRAVYRTGQRVLFKAILITKDPHTGESILFTKKIFSRHNNDSWKKWYNAKKRQLFVNDPFGRVIGSVPIDPDEYGSFSGTIVIPKSASTGEYEFDVEDISIPYSMQTFKVEEYKRPTFELLMLPPEKTFYPGDTVDFLLKVHSFSGAPVFQTKITYSISKGDAVIAKGTGWADTDGKLKVSVFDSAVLQQSRHRETEFRYNITATATDLSGESQDLEDHLVVASMPVDIHARVHDTYTMENWEPILIMTWDRNGRALSKDLKIHIYKILSSHWPFEKDYSRAADQWIYPASALEKWFPKCKFGGSPVVEQKQLIYEGGLHTGAYDRLWLPASQLGAGQFEIEIQCVEGGRLVGEKNAKFQLIDVRSEARPSENSFFYMPENYCRKGDTLRIYSGSRYDSTYAIIQIKYYSTKNNQLKVISVLDHQAGPAGVHLLSWSIPKDVKGQILVSRFFIKDNSIYRKDQQVWIDEYQERPRIVIERYRSQLAPGGSVHFSVSVKTADKSTAAQLMTTIYDASLDRLEKHKWETPREEYERTLQSNWPWELAYQSEGEISHTPLALLKEDRATPLWWLKDTAWLDYRWNFGDEPETIPNQTNPLLTLLGPVPELFVANVEGLQEVLSGGWTTSLRLNTGSVTTIRMGYTFAQIPKKALVVLDGMVYRGSKDSIDKRIITEAIFLDKGDAVPLYGAAALNGVLIISTKGKIQLPEKTQEQVVKVRQNFNETAYFSPNVPLGKDGLYSFTFTVPESLTEWQWKLLAHTRNARFAYAERKLNTFLPLAIQPNIPRCLYQGDKVIIKSKIANLDSAMLSGKVVCQVLDAVTGEEMTSQLVSQPAATISLGGRSSGSSAFFLTVPAGQLHPLKIICKVSAQGFSDGEEHIVPVLTTRQWLTQQENFRLANRDTLLLCKPLADGDSLFGVGLSLNGQPTATILGALPWLANFSYDCAEQTFNKVLANIAAIQIMRRDTALRGSYNLAKDTRMTDVQNSTLPTSLPSEVTPWLSLSQQAKAERQQLMQLLDTIETKSKIEGLIARLYKLQNPDGGLSWFGGQQSNPYISKYVLAGFGKLEKMGWMDPALKNDKYQHFIQDLLRYVDEHFTTGPDLAYIYARRTWSDQYPLGRSALDSIKKYIAARCKSINGRNLYEQAMLVVVVRSYFNSQDSLYKMAQTELDNIWQTAISDDQAGVRWKAVADADDFYNSQEETLELLVEAFRGTPYYNNVRAGVLKWLMGQKTDHHWSSTKATAAVIGLLYESGQNISGHPQQLTAVLSNKELTVSDELLRGNLSAFYPTHNNPSSIRLRKSTDGLSTGAIIHYSFGQPHPESTGVVSLSKQLSKFNESTHAWEPINDTSLIHIADRIRAIITITTKKALNFVHISDKKGAALEPLEFNSGITSRNGLNYYQSIRDDGCQFFFDYIPGGRWAISYDLRASYEGQFMVGPASLDCMYKPDVHAYSAGTKIQVR